jgi:NTP pyrophosphatase (non-canonical NTP hydrolase)
MSELDKYYCAVHDHNHKYAVLCPLCVAGRPKPSERHHASANRTMINLIYCLIDEERESQDQKSPEALAENTLDRWHVILSEEVGEVARAILERDKAQYLKELIQVAAVAIAAYEAVLIKDAKQ